MKVADLEKYVRCADELFTYVELRDIFTYMREIKRPLVEQHKKILGKQHLTACLGSENRRFYVWQLHPDVVLLINSHKGIVIDVTENATKEVVVDVVYQYLGTMLK